MGHRQCVIKYTMTMIICLVVIHSQMHVTAALKEKLRGSRRTKQGEIQGKVTLMSSSQKEIGVAIYLAIFVKILYLYGGTCPVLENLLRRKLI